MKTLLDNIDRVCTWIAAHPEFQYQSAHASTSGTPYVCIVFDVPPDEAIWTCTAYHYEAEIDGMHCLGIRAVTMPALYHV